MKIKNWPSPRATRRASPLTASAVGQGKLKIVAVVAIFVLLGISVPQHETKAFLGFGDFTFTEELPGPLMAFNGITSGVTTALDFFTSIIQPAFEGLVKMLIRQAIITLKNQTIKWIVTGQFDKPQFVGSFQADPRKIAENASRIFLSRLTGINFCQFNQNIPSSNLLFSAKLNIQLDCRVPGLAGNGKIETDWFRAGFPTLWGITHPQNNGWDVLGRVVVQKQINEQNALNAFYNEILTNAGVNGLRDSKGNIITPGQYLSQALNSTIEKSYPDIGQIGTDPASLIAAVTQAIGEILDAGLKKAINEGLTKAFK